MAKYNNIDEYINSFPKDVQLKLEDLRKTIKEVMPNCTEKISWNMPTFYLNGNIVHFAAFKNHIGFYPTDSGVSQFENKLKDYDLTKGSIRFSYTTSLPYDLIKRIVKFRVNEVNDKNKI